MNSEAITLLVAIYGAVTATAAIGWDFYKWKKAGPKLAVTVTSWVTLTSDNFQVGEYEALVVNVSNRGDRATTITGLIVERSGLKPKRLWLTEPSERQPLPYKVEPGGIWTGVIRKSESLLQVVGGGKASVFVHHSHSMNPVRCRIRI